MANKTIAMLMLCATILVGIDRRAESASASEYIYVPDANGNVPFHPTSCSLKDDSANAKNPPTYYIYLTEASAVAFAPGMHKLQPPTQPSGSAAPPRALLISYTGHPELFREYVLSKPCRGAANSWNRADLELLADQGQTVKANWSVFAGPNTVGSAVEAVHVTFFSLADQPSDQISMRFRVQLKGGDTLGGTISGPLEKNPVRVMRPLGHQN